jgi:hypothetical protein
VHLIDFQGLTWLLFRHLILDMTHEWQQFHFDSFGPGMRDALVYYHRDLTPSEVATVQEILLPLLHQTRPLTTAQFWLVDHDFSKALDSLKAMLNQ